MLRRRASTSSRTCVVGEAEPSEPAPEMEVDGGEIEGDPRMTSDEHEIASRKGQVEVGRMVALRPVAFLLLIPAARPACGFSPGISKIFADMHDGDQKQVEWGSEFSNEVIIGPYPVSGIAPWQVKATLISANCSCLLYTSPSPRDS